MGQNYRRLLFGALAITMIPVAMVRAADPDALWKIVHDRCVPHEQGAADPAPCAAVDLAGGYAILKDRDGVSQFLLIPTARIEGIESPEILAPDAPNFWDDAWHARGRLDDMLHHKLPRDDVSLAINSPSGRSQDQLHIHIDCIRADIRDVLRQHEGEITTSWQVLSIPLNGHAYRAMRIEREELGADNPFKLLREKMPVAPTDMRLHTIVVVGAVFKDGRNGFYLLDDQADLLHGDVASGEELQDHGCTVAQALP